MELGEQIKQQRVKHIVRSYQLEGNETEAFHEYLNQLLNCYPAPMVELALVEVLVNSWLRVPMPRGRAFLAQAHEQLKRWEDRGITTTIAPEQFHQITGLDPGPIFGLPNLPLQQPTHPTGTGF